MARQVRPLFLRFSNETMTMDIVNFKEIITFFLEKIFSAKFQYKNILFKYFIIFGIIIGKFFFFFNYSKHVLSVSKVAL